MSNNQDLFYRLSNADAANTRQSDVIAAAAETASTQRLTSRRKYILTAVTDAVAVQMHSQPGQTGVVRASAIVVPSGSQLRVQPIADGHLYAVGVSGGPFELRINEV